MPMTAWCRAFPPRPPRRKTAGSCARLHVTSSPRWSEPVPNPSRTSPSPPLGAARVGGRWGSLRSEQRPGPPHLPTPAAWARPLPPQGGEGLSARFRLHLLPAQRAARALAGGLAFGPYRAAVDEDVLDAGGGGHRRFEGR